MNGFLKEVVANIASNHQSFDEVVIIVPSQRTGLYVKHLLAEELNRTIFSPRIETVQSFVQLSSELNLVDPFELLFICYEAYLKISNKDESFGNFISWAPTLINDFNEIDHYLLNPKTVFSNLTQVKEIEEWSFNETELSEGQENFQSFWELLYPIYNEVNTLLINDKKGYQGQITRLVAENLSNLKHWQGKQLYIVGVNALTTAEETIVKTLKADYNATIFWDNDDYYLNNPAHEAGLFQRRFAKDWAPEIKATSNKNFTTEKNITTYEVSGTSIQTKLAGNILAQWQSQNSIDGSALVLADETLLIPAISSLPETLSKANITMGYPAAQSPIFQLFQVLLAIQEHYLRQGDQKLVHHSLLKEVLNHPVISDLASRNVIESITQYITKQNLVFLSFSQIETLITDHEVFNEILKLALLPWKKLPEDCFITWGKLAANLQEHITNKIDKELLFKFASILKTLSNLSGKHNYLNDLDVLKKFIQRLISKELIPFFGEPLQGLQIMGMLETRALDFEKLIVLSVNEGVLPKGNAQPSFIPHDLKRYYKLPTHFEKDAIYAYHFYRLIQRAKEIHLVYNTAKDGFSKGEKSRFITQLLLEYPGKINHVTIDIPYQSEALSDTIVFDALLTNKMDKYLTEKGLSPSALNTYLHCPKDFALKYLFQIREPNNIEETLQDNSIGTVVHEVLEKLFEPLLNFVLTEAHCDSMTKKADSLILATFQKYYPNVVLTSGPNYLALEVAKKQVKGFIKRQLTEIKNSEPITILGLEKEFACHINIRGTQVKLKGIIDRVDKVGNKLRILDYKTGKVIDGDLKISANFGVSMTDQELWHQAFSWKNEKVNQLLFYLFAAQASDVVSNYKQLEMTAGIIALNNVSESSVFYLKDTDKQPLIWNEEHHDFIKDALGEIIEKMMAEEGDEISHTERNPSYCLLCD